MTDRRVAIITGGGAGIGEAVCKRLAADGMAVGVADIDRARAEAVAQGIRDDGGEAIPIEADVTDEASVKAMFDTLLDAYGKVNYVGANAGVFIYGDFLTFSYEDWRRMLDINVTGMLLTCRYGARQMISQGPALGPYSMMLGLSQGSFMQDPPSTCYITTKWAARGLMRSMACDLAPYDITVNGIGPGSVLTDLHRYVNEQIAARKGMTVEEATAMMGNGYPLKGYQSAEEMAAIYRFAFSDEARNITGVTIMDNGGNVML